MSERTDRTNDRAGDLVDAAYAAARSGRTHDLESALAALRQVDPDEVVQIQDRLRGIVECVHAHPSFRRAAGRVAS